MLNEHLVGQLQVVDRRLLFLVYHCIHDFSAQSYSVQKVPLREATCAGGCHIDSGQRTNKRYPPLLLSLLFPFRVLGGFLLPC